MKEIELLPVEREGERIWLPISYNGNTTRIAYPAFTGTHQRAFEAIGKDRALVPAQGLDLALIAHGAYSGKSPEWKDIRQDAFVINYIRSPTLNIWIPKGFIKGDANLSGVLVQKDLNGKGLTDKVNVPDLNKFKQEDSGLYVSADAIFVPSDKYKLGGHTVDSFSKDGIALATLTPEGAELFAKTAIDAGKTPYIWGIDTNTIANPEKRVSLLDESEGRFYLIGLWGVGRDGRAFGVSASKS